MMNAKKNIPILKKIRSTVKSIISPSNRFTTTEDYWKNRYARGGNSGSGSYDRLAEFKADIINDFVKENGINSVIELGSGDGNQIEYFTIPEYIGFDISPIVIENCNIKYADDPSKSFYLYDELDSQKADASMSLDVLYHLIEDDLYESYLNKLFNSADRFVIIYAHDSDDNVNWAPHVKPRKFTDWIKKNRSDFKFVKHIPNKYPYVPNDQDTSFADFYFYERIGE